MRADLVKAILRTGLLAGTLDALGATAHFLAVGGKEPIRIWWYVASAVFGREVAFAGGWPMAFVGLLFHYFIASSFTAFYFLMYPRVAFAAEHPVIAGIIYGISVWSMMNFIVIPLTRIPPSPFDLSKASVAATVIVLCIGLPIALSARRYYSR